MWIFEYYDLIRILTISDLKVKYQSSILGFLWSLLNPFLMLMVLYVVFSGMYDVSEESFIVYLFIGITSWRFFSNGTTTSVRSIVSKSNLVTKIFIPRKILVFSGVVSSFISSLLEFFILFLLLIVFRVSFTPNMLYFPFVTLIYFGIVFGAGLALGALYVFYRDLDQIWEVVISIGFFLSPIIYPVTLIPDRLLPIYMLNPVTVVMQMYREILLYGSAPSLLLFGYGIIAAVILLIAGSSIFGSLEWRFAEEI